MDFLARFLAWVFLITFLPLSFAQDAPKPQKPSIPDEEAAKLAYTYSLAGFEDQGSFTLRVNEEPLGTTDFTWQKDGRYESHFNLKMGGQTMQVDLSVIPSDGGVWKRIEMKAARGPVLVEREGRLSTVTFQEKKSTVQLQERSALFDNYGPALGAAIVKEYDAAKAGKQTLSICLPGGGQIDGALERLEKAEKPVAGKDLVFSRYRLSIQTIDIDLWLDNTGRVVLEEVPVQKAVFIRKGFEELAAKSIENPLLSTASFDVTINKDTMVPCRDGVKLATDVYLPKADGKIPLIVYRTPYGKELMELNGKYWARRGYACAIQDCRGRFKSEGNWVPFMHEAEDGHDTIEWLAGQPWCNGKVGMIGGSYLGWVQWWAASQKPAHLVTIIPNVAPPDPHYNIPFEHGAFFLLGSIWWAQILESEATADLSGAKLSEVGESDYSKILTTLPVIDLDKVLMKKENRYWRDWIGHPDNGKFWEKANFLEKLKTVNIPVFHQSGWFDGDGIGTKLNYLKMRSFGHANQKMIVGPWGHTDTSSRGMGDKDFGKDAAPDLQREYVQWFDFWLKGVKNGVDAEPMVRLFAMGSNKWLTGNTYPLEQTEFRKLLLKSGGKANTGKGDGRLVWSLPADSAEFDSYTYDPGDPTPDPSFYPTRSQEERKKIVLSNEEEKKRQEAFHRETVDKRTDILVYLTEPLEASLTFCGPLSAVLYASSSAADTDWFVTVSEEKADGKIFPLVHGKIRARYRNSMSKPEKLKPGEVVKYTLDLWHTGITIPKGDRLRVEVASALFPTFGRNLNTGGHNEMETRFVKAEQKVFHSEKYPSHVLLPVIPENGKGSKDSE
ncbi:MAG: CocE/NonD family hydrolase [Acidobacteria bacterium]|nr:MAG: CocE/NonD family hydrolase [Acidobacteriota bacterium]